MVKTLPAAVMLSGLPEEEMREILQGDFPLKIPSSSSPSPVSEGGRGSRGRRAVDGNFYLDVATTLEETFLGVAGVGQERFLKPLAWRSEDGTRESVKDPSWGREGKKYHGDVVEKVQEERTGFKCEPIDSKHAEVRYQSRDLLDLYANIKYDSFCEAPTVKVNNIADFVEFRSILSRLDGVGMPRHLMVTCKDCLFREPKFY